ncbi:pyocin knob domain-containing protein [Serratia marcescens]|uniref:pyocin knob domain-containing protein n=1 Tax=Serratia marcescens TaxID=615 RepID=UPI0021B59633|nr:pyocin knob domain-containing protein [Serratia marcescens]
MTKIKLSSGSTTPISRAAQPLDERKSLDDNKSSSVEISALPDATDLHGENLIPVVQTINGVKGTRKARLDELVKFMPMGLPPLNAQLNGGRKTTEEMKQEYAKFLDGSYVEPISYYYSVVSSDDSVSYSQLTAYPTDGGFYVFANGVGINGNDNVVLKIVFKGDKNGFPIFVQDLELSHGDGSGIVDLHNTTDLNSVVEPGNYFVNGTDKWSSLGYPFSVAVGNKVVMSVSTVRSGKFDTVCQTFFATNLSFKPGPHARILTDAGWSIWDGMANFSYLDVNFLKTPVLEQLDLKISEAIGDRPTIYSYKKPTNDGTGPNVEFTPSANPGVVISLPWGFKSQNQGTFGGLVFAGDSIGNFYVNVDLQKPDAPASWKRFAFDGEATVKLDPNKNNLLSNSSDGLLLDRYKAPNVGITGTYVSTNHGPDFTGDNAFSTTGGVWRVKNTLMLSRVPAKYSGAVIVDISLGKIPCDSSGIPLQYTLSKTTTSKQVSGVWRQHSVMILAIIGTPAKLMDVVSGALEDYSDGVAWNVSVKYTFGEMAPSV